MRVGKMRYRIEIQDYISSTDADGFNSEGWNTIYIVWADITPVSGKEYLSLNQVTSEVTNKIYIRHLKDIKSSMRIKRDIRIYSIQSILTDDKAGMMTIMAVEVE